MTFSRSALAASLLLFGLSTGLAAEPIRVSGRVLTEREKGGAAGVRVELLPWYEGYEEAARRLGGAAPAPLATARTDGAGFFQLQAPESGCFRLRVRAEGYLAEEHLLVPLVEDTGLPPAQMVRAGQLEARATDPGGRPLSGIVIRVPDDQRMISWDNRSWQLEPALGLTGADGRAFLPASDLSAKRVLTTSPRFLGQSATGASGRSLTLRLSPERAVRIEVRRSDGQPAVGALARWDSRPIGVTGPEGRLEISIPEEGPPVTIESREGEQARIVLPSQAAGTAGRLFVLRLAPPRTLTGKVVDAVTGAPLANALVWTGGPRLLAAPVHSGPDGSFRLAVPAGEDISLAAAAPGHLLAGKPSAPRDRPGPILLKLAPAFRLAGVVVDKAGRPVSGVSLALGPQPKESPSPGAGKIHAWSRADGRFQVPGLTFNAAYRIKTQRRGFAEASVQGRTPAPGQSPLPLRIVLGAGQTLLGKTVDESGRPVARADLVLGTGEEPFLLEKERAVSDETGRFEIRGLNPGTFQLVIRHKGFSETRVPGIEVASDNPVKDLGPIELRAGAAVEGRVTDTRGRPIEGADVEAERDTFFIVDETGGGPQNLKPRATTGPDGTFRLEDLEPGKLDLDVRRAGYLPANVPGVAVPTAEPLHVELKTARGIAGRVVGPEGEPVPEAALSWIQATRSGGGGMMRSSFLATTDADGRFQAIGLPGGPVDLQVSAKRYKARKLEGIDIPQDRDLEGFEIRLERGTTLVVRVLAPRGEPVPQAWVRAVPVRPKPGSKRDPGMDGLLDLTGAPMGNTDNDGVCSIELPGPGSYTVNASSGSRRASLAVEAGPEVTSAEIRFRSGMAVSGRVVDGEGQGIPEASILLRPAGERQAGFGAASELDGSFTIEDVADGSYQVNAYREGYSQAEPHPLEVAGLPVENLVLRLDKKKEGRAAVVGRILGLSPSDAARSHIEAAPSASGDGFPRRGIIQPDGSYRIRGLEPGTWMVTVSTPSGRQAHKEAQVPTEDSEVVLDFDLGGLDVLGKILVDGAPLSGAQIQLLSQGTFQASGQTAYDGGFQLTVSKPGDYDLFVLSPRGAIGYAQPVRIEERQPLTVDIPTGSLSGRVLAAGGPVADAVITVQGFSKTVPYGFFAPTIRSDGAGGFETRLAAGTYKLKLISEGFAPAEVQVEVKPGQENAVEVRLTPR